MITGYFITVELQQSIFWHLSIICTYYKSSIAYKAANRKTIKTGHDKNFGTNLLVLFVWGGGIWKSMCLAGWGATIILLFGGLSVKKNQNTSPTQWKSPEYMLNNIFINIMNLKWKQKMGEQKWHWFYANFAILWI